MHRKGDLFLIILICSLLTIPTVITGQTQVYNAWIVHEGFTPSTTFDKPFFNWIRTITGITPTYISKTNLPEIIPSDVKIVAIPYLSYISPQQTKTLETYVINGGSLFTSYRTDLLTNTWFNTASTGSKNPNGFTLTRNPVYNLTFGDYTEIPDFISSWAKPGYFTDTLPDTIQPILLDSYTGNPMIYTGTYGEGKLSLVPGYWTAYSIRYPTTSNPIMLQLIEYLENTDGPKLLRGETQQVSIRIDDIWGTASSIIYKKNLNNVFRSHNVTEITYGIVPNERCDPEFWEEFGSITNAEYGMHGDITGHVVLDGYDYDTAYDQLGRGKQAILDNFGIPIRWYIQAANGIYNPVNSGVLRAIEDLNMDFAGATDYGYNYYTDELPGYNITDLSAVTGWDEAGGLNMLWSRIWMFEELYHLDHAPFTIVNHAKPDNSLFSELIRYMKTYPDVTFVTHSKTIENSHNTMNIAGLETESNIKIYTWTNNNYESTITLKCDKTFTTYIQYNKTITEAKINGLNSFEFTDNILKTPLLESDTLHTITVKYGDAPTKPVIVQTTTPNIVMLPGSTTYHAFTIQIENPNPETVFNITPTITSNYETNIITPIYPVMIDETLDMMIIVETILPFDALDPVSTEIKLDIESVYGSSIEFIGFINPLFIN